MPWILVASLASAGDLPLERRLYADRVDSSSFLWNDWNRFQENYHPNYAADDDPATAWVEGASSSGAGEWIRFNLTPLDGTTAVRLRVRNGYQKSSGLYKANARPKEVTVTFLPGGQARTATLTDSEGWQELRFEQPAGRLEAVRLDVASVYPGTKYTDLCVSDVEIYATAATRDNPVVEKGRLDRLLAWKRDRVAAAAVFKAAAAGSVPIAPAYALRAIAASAIAEDIDTYTDKLVGGLLAVNVLAGFPSEPGLPAPTAALDLARVAFTTRFAGWEPVQAVAKDTRPIPAVEGFAPATIWNCFEGPSVWSDTDSGTAHGHVELPAQGQLGFLRNEGIGTFAISNPPTVEEALRETPAVCGRDEAQHLSWAKMAPATTTQPARVQALFSVTCATVEAREGSDRVSVPQLLVYDDAGRLVLLVGRNSATSFGWRGEGAGAVLSDALRVGQYAPAVRVSEGRPPSP